MNINKNKEDLFDSTNACHKEIWNMLVKNDISAFANGRWSDVENDFEKNKFLGTHANFSSNPSDWAISFPTLDDYRKSWLQQSHECIQKDYIEPIKKTLLKISSIASIKINKNKAAVLKKIDGVVEKHSGDPDILKWQTLYFCQFIGNKWKIIGFVGYLPIKNNLYE